MLRGSMRAELFVEDPRRGPLWSKRSQIPDAVFKIPMDSPAADVPQLLVSLPRIKEEEDEPQWKEEKQNDSSCIKEEKDELDISQVGGERVEGSRAKEEEDEEAAISSVLPSRVTGTEPEVGPSQLAASPRQSEVDGLVPPLTDSPETGAERRETSYSCRRSPEGLTRRTLLESHMRMHTPKEQSSRSLCSRKLKSHVRAREGEKPLLCSALCGEGLCHDCGFTEHRRSQLGKNCALCAESLASKCNLNIHTRRHGGKKPFSHRKEFGNTHTLVSRTRSHAGEKPFSCTACAKTRRNGKARVRRQHAAENPLDCSICGESFTLKRHLTAQSKSHVRKKPFCCSVCARAFVYKSRLKTHLEKHTAEELAPYYRRERERTRKKSRKFKLQPRAKASSQYCCVPLCHASARYNGVLSYFSFPADEEIRRRWTVAIRRDNYRVTNHSWVCSRHFQKEDVRGPASEKGRRGLKRGAVPVLFEWNNYSFPSGRPEEATADREHAVSWPADAGQKSNPPAGNPPAATEVAKVGTSCPSGGRRFLCENRLRGSGGQNLSEASPSEGGASDAFGDWKILKEEAKPPLKETNVKISVGLMQLVDGVLKPLRGTVLPLWVKKGSDAEELRHAALRRLRAFIQNFPSAPCVVLYRDGSKVVNIAATKNRFSLEDHKKAAGKAYQRITLYVCTADDFLAYSQTSATRSEDSHPEAAVTGSDGFAPRSIIQLK
ncbi:zinc finger protein 62 homolog isoform X2 [Syngnathoides biaculeatus]|uniref:zinc finger protein 62 homolog isoform X2 n=1 Tax=Syngnathoides biaculeatus TaxID=300417 RepID=UPI002ADDC49A|nr:zinc finger protein 62 homolog isoform X2 [Syngnathoides biaculeatus]